MQRPRLAWLRHGLVCLVMGLAACGSSAASDSAEQIYVLDVSAISDEGFVGRGQQAWIDDVAAKGLAHARWFRAEGSGPTLTARLAYAERVDADDRAVLRVELVVDADVALGAALAKAGLEPEATVEVVRRDGTVDVRRDLPIAVERAVGVMDAKVSVARGEPAAIAVLLGDSDPEVVRIGLEGVGRLRLRMLGDTVAQLVEHEDEGVSMLAVECLGEIGGPEHAPGLLRSVRLADRAYANRLYFALANLGGAQARGFLEFAARNEDDPEMATLAAQALERLDSVARATPVPPSEAAPAIGRGHRQ